ncbi:MAG TPA: amino acid adenylation domain-containing protein [Pyrinomonadaceae bacterium]
MSTIEFLSRLRAVGVGLRADGERLRYTAAEGALTPELREELAARKAEVMSFLREAQSSSSASASDAQRVRPAPRGGELPLSFAQQRLWFVQQLEPGSPAYNMPVALRLEGRFDAGAMAAALGEVVRRHEALRTTFAQEGGRPVQVINEPRGLELPVVDLSTLPEAERERRLRAVLTEESLRPFDLERGPLLRAGVIRLREEEHVLHATMHHIVSDGWSIGVLVREVGALYAAFSEGRESPLAELPVQYADYAAWQRGWLQGEVLERQLAYWREHLTGAAVLELPTDRPRPPVQSFRGASLAFGVPAPLAARLEELSQRGGVTLFMTLLAALNVLLHRYTGQEDITVGTAMANRSRAEVEGLIGFFVNTLALRTRVAGDDSFAELLARVREVTFCAYAHQDLPFEKLVEELQPRRDPGRPPLFQIMLVMQNAPLGEQRLPGLRASALGVEGTTTKFDITFSVTKVGDELLGNVEYSTDLFDEATVERMCGHLLTLLEAVAAHPARAVADLPLLTDEEGLRLVRWNETRTDYPRDLCVHQLFERQAAATPGAVAVVEGREELSYGELNERANRIARALRRRGVGHESRVGLLMERGTEAVVSLLGVLKAGGAYVPLDPEYPQERLRFMLEDAGVGVVLAGGEPGALPGVAEGVEVLNLSGAAEELSAESCEDLGCVATADSAAYVIYTSGSTGRPKGVMVAHRAVVRLVLNTDYVSLSAGDCVAQLATVSFDASTFELWGALLNGARVAVIPKELALSPPDLAAELRRLGVTTTFITTALFNRLAREREALKGVREVLFGGEAADPRVVRSLLSGGGAPRRLLHVYGPTENTTFSTWELVTEVGAGAETVPIGQPIANSTAHVLDRRMRPVPSGVAGELYVGGEGLARGYVGRPALTAERFVPDPFGAAGGGRLYRTGDRVRRLGDGAIEFLGRLDGQVKVRGFRIEPGEVEAALRGHACVRDAVVVARAEAEGGKRLVAYVVAEAGAGQPSVGELRAHLRGSLPDYMVPSEFVAIDELPLNANGKVDRGRLPEPDGGRLQPSGEHAEPRTALEEAVSGLWADVLGAERVSVEADFFELGGHSLLAAQLVSRVRKVFDVELSLKSFFLSPTVAGMARAIEQASRGGDDAAPVPPPLVPVARDAALPLSFAQQRLWIVTQLEPESAAYHIPSAVRMTGALDVPALARALDALAERHESLRTVFESAGEWPSQVVLPARGVALARADLSGLAEAEREAMVGRMSEEEARRPFDMRRGPLWRVSLLRLGDEEHVLLLVMHHIITDGWSLNILIDELSTLYRAFAEGRPSPLAELPVQYADFAAWQRRWLSGEVMERLVEYWRRRLAGAPPVLELPADRPRPPAQSFRGASHAFTIPDDLARELRGLSRREGATLFMTLLAAFQTLLYRYTGQTDVVVGADMNGRGRPETERLIGFFIDMLVLRNDLSGNPPFAELLARVRQTSLGAYAHMDVPFDKLVEELQPRRSLAHTPIFQVVFNFENSAQRPPDLPGLRLERQRFELREIKFDLSLFVFDRRDSLEGMWTYSTDLFDAARVERMHRHFEGLLRAVVENPSARVDALSFLGEEERARQAEAKDALRRSNLQKFKSVRPKSVTQSRRGLVRTERLPGGDPLPLVVRPEAEDLDLALWAKNDLPLVERQLAEHGAVLFRGFNVNTLEDFGHVSRAVSTELLDYSEPSSPRTELSARIYTSTEYPADQWIQMHNEMSYAHRWPKLVFFFCQQPAARGGETPLAYSRKVYELLDPRVRQRFIEKRVTYVRNFGDGLDLSWRHVFGTDDKAAVEAYCRAAGIEFEWKRGDRLTTRQTRQSVARHPATGEVVWFNQAHAFHASALEPHVREALRAEMPEEEFPRHACYGDGSPIDDWEMEAVREAYRGAVVSFPWEAGDVVMLDNMRVAHGRAPYEGPRRVLVAMSGTVSAAEVDA